MTLAGQRLAVAQLSGHRLLDTAFQPLARDVEAIVLRHARPDPNGVLRLTIASRGAILLEIGRVLDGARPDLIRAILGAVTRAMAAAEFGVEPLSPAERPPLPAAGPLWLSLEKNQANVISQTGALLVRGIAAGAAASAVAKQVSQYLSPWFSPRRSETGALLRTDREGAVRHWPGRAGMASAHVRGLMLDAATAGHFRATRQLAARDDGLLSYHLSYQHLETDECTVLERRDVGFGPGIYPPDDAPAVPRHRRCRCYYGLASRPRFLARSESVAA